MQAGGEGRGGGEEDKRHFLKLAGVMGVEGGV